MHDLWAEFSKVALAHLLAVVSPGPDFAIVLKQSLAHGRRTATWTSLGIGSAILLHIGYSLLGLGLLVAGSARWFDAVKYAGAAYLAWLGVQALRSKPRENAMLGSGVASSPPAAGAAFLTGFLTNALNPKATLFFIALFSVVIDPRTPRLVQIGYGAWMAIVTAGWFVIVSFAFTQETLRRRFLRHGHWIDRALGVVFIAFAASLVVANL